MYKFVNFESLAARIFLGVVFLLPLFVLPFGIFAVDFNKAMLAYLGILLSFVLYILGRIAKGSIIVPKSFILLSLAALSVVGLVSAYFSGDMRLGVFGSGYETGTVASLILLVLLAFLVPVLFRTVNHIALLYKTVFLSAIVLFVVQVLHTGFGLPVPPWGMFQGKLSSVLGSWSDLGIFFGFIVILALSSIELRGEGKRVRMFLWAVLFMGILGVLFINFSTLQYVLGIFVLGLLVDRLVHLSKKEEASSGKLIFRDPSFFVFVIIVASALAHNWIGVAINFLGIQFTQITPSWSATYEIVKATLSTSPLLGSGPNTFLYDWSLFRPDAISATSFWNTQFSSGTGKLPSLIAELGALGGVVIVMLIASLILPIKKVLGYKEHNLERMILVSSFMSALYLWTFTILYSPGFLIFAFAGLFTGVFIAALGFTRELPFIEIAFVRDLKKSFVVYAVMGTIVLGTLYGFFVFGSKYLASYFYTTAITRASQNANLESVGVNLERAIFLDPQDVYFRSVSEMGLINLGQIITATSGKEDFTEEEKNQFRNILTFTVQSAKNATIANPRESENWMQLGKVYENLLQLDEKGFKGSALLSYKEALRVSPKNPASLLALARVEAQTGNTEGATSYLKDALMIKGNYTEALLMGADIIVSKGEIKDAIGLLDQAVTADQNNPDNVYLIMRIGALHYQDGDLGNARSIFENIVKVNPNYVDARYSLGLVYEKSGMTTKAIEQFEIIDKLVPNNQQIQTILSNLRAGESALGGNQ